MAQDTHDPLEQANDQASPSAPDQRLAPRRGGIGRRASWLLIVAGAVLGLVSAFMLARPFLSRLIPQSPQTVSQTAQVDDLLVTLRVDEADVGERTIDVVITDAARQPVIVDRVQLRLTMTDMIMGQNEPQAQLIAPGHFRANRVVVSMLGWWDVEAIVERAALPALHVNYKLAIGMPDVVQPLPVRDVSEPLPSLVFERDGNLWRSDGADKAPVQLTRFPVDEQVRYPSVSPDGQRIALVTTLRGAIPPTSTLYLMNLDGSGQRAVWTEPRCWMGQSAWLPDGQGVLISTNHPATQTAWGPADYQITRVDFATGAHQPILDNADSPAISPDGTTLLYVWTSTDRTRLELRAAALDGSDMRTLLSDTGFSHLFAPHFSPDGTRIVFAGAEGPPTNAQGNPTASIFSSPPEPHAAITTVEAERARSEVWVVQRDGTGLQRLTTFAETLPMALFSPDGAQLVVLGRNGVYMAASHGGELRRITPTPTKGGGVWFAQK